MSMARCDDCESVFDSDEDPEAIFETTPQAYVTLCRWCRERAEDAADALKTEGGER